MIKIALCDDNEVERRLLKRIVASAMEEQHREVLIVEFSSGEKLQRNFSRGDYDIIFLDICMKEMNGIEAGRVIRKKDAKVEIILATGSDQYFKEGYELHAFAYLMKPYDVAQIQATLQDFFHRNLPETVDEDMEFLRFSMQQRKICIHQREISVVESEGRIVRIYQGGEVYKVYERLNEMEKQLDMRRFLRCNQSYIVNVEHVEGIVDYDFHMKDGSIIPIRKRDKKDIVQKYYQKKSELPHMNSSEQI